MKYLYLVCFMLLGDRGDFSDDSQLIDNQVVESFQRKDDHHFPEIYNYIRTEVEGNYSFHPDDKGGETYGGIARRLHPDWFGWRYVDQARPHKRHDRIEKAEIHVLDFYLTIWVTENFEIIENKELAKNLFDLRIHSSPKTVTRITNRVLNEMGYCPIKVGENWINEDFNHLNAEEFILRLKIQRLILFNYLVTKSPNQRVFYNGWINRLTNI